MYVSKHCDEFLESINEFYMLTLVYISLIFHSQRNIRYIYTLVLQVHQKCESVACNRCMYYFVWVDQGQHIDTYVELKRIPEKRNTTEMYTET